MRWSLIARTVNARSGKYKPEEWQFPCTLCISIAFTMGRYVSIYEVLQCFAYYKLCIFMQCVSQTTIKWATSALSTVRHQKRDFGLANMTKWSARWPLIVRRVPSKGREFKPQPERSGGQYSIWWISQWSIYTCIYIRKSMLRISISITECLDMSRIFVIFPCISRIKSTGSGSRLKRKWRNDSLLYLTCFFLVYVMSNNFKN